MVPMRAIFEALGAKVSWDGPSQTVCAIKGNTHITIGIGAPVAHVNVTNIPLDQSAIILNGSTMVPVRFVSEALGARVNWNSETQTVEIFNPGAAHFNTPIKYEPAQQGSEYLYPRGDIFSGADGFPGDIKTDGFAVFEKPQWGLSSFKDIAKASLDAAYGNFGGLWELELKIFASQSELTNHYHATVFNLTRYHLYDKALQIYALPGNGCFYDILYDKTKDNSIDYLGNKYVKENCAWVGVYDDRNPNKYLLVFSGKWIPVCQSSILSHGFNWQGVPLIEKGN